MSRRHGDRRRTYTETRYQPPSSPANLLLLTVIGVLGITAAAAAFMDSGYDDVTPHGRLLGDLNRVARAQEYHYQRNGTFAEWIRTLGVEPSADVRLSITRAEPDRWEAAAFHPVGLTCTQGGTIVGNVVRTDQPVCFTHEP